MPVQQTFATEADELAWIRNHNGLVGEELEELLVGVRSKWARKHREARVIVKEVVTNWKGPAVGLRYRKMFLGAPVLQQEWIGLRELPDGRRETVREWRDVPVEVA